MEGRNSLFYFLTLVGAQDESERKFAGLIVWISAENKFTAQAQNDSFISIFQTVQKVFMWNDLSTKKLVSYLYSQLYFVSFSKEII